MYQRVGAAAMKKDLSNIIALCKHLQQPHQRFKSVHIAGTNGKGSVTHIIASVLQSHGLKVGCYTSPHYRDFRERIKINGKLIPEAKVVEFVADNQQIIETIQPSFFEITVAMAFDYFASEEIDIAIIETGLGGRLDSTNIITPLLSVITNIGYDHQAMLGETLPEIAGEKAGIIKENIPVLIGEYQKEVIQVFEHKANAMNSQLFYANEFFPIQNYTSTLNGSSFQFPFGKRKIHCSTDLIGQYQKKNLQTALAAIQLLQKHFSISIQTIQSGLETIRNQTHFLGRMMILDQTPTVLVDSAHNIDGLNALLAELEQFNFDQLHFVYGTVNDKDLNKILPVLPSKAQYYFCAPNIPRGLPTNELLPQALKHKLQGKPYNNVTEAFNAAKKAANKQDLVLVSGSIFIVAEII